jgi:hypothetical protein
LAGFKGESSVHGGLLGSGQISNRGLTNTDLDVLSGLLNKSKIVRQMRLEFGRLDSHVTNMVVTVGRVKVELGQATYQTLKAL